MADILGHHLVFLQLFEKDILVEAENILQVSEDQLLFQIGTFK